MRKPLNCISYPLRNRSQPSSSCIQPGKPGLKVVSRIFRTFLERRVRSRALNVLQSLRWFGDYHCSILSDSLCGDLSETGTFIDGFGRSRKSSSPRSITASTSENSKTSLRMRRPPTAAKASIAVRSQLRLHGQVLRSLAVGADVRCWASRASTLSAKPSLMRFGSRSGTSWIT